MAPSAEYAAPEAKPRSTVLDSVLKTFPNGLPTLDKIKARNKGQNIPPETAWIWGKDDELGRINLLTPTRIQTAKEEELKDGDVVSLNGPITLPAKPSFGRHPRKHTIVQNPDFPMAFDDYVDMNTQSGSQWDGFRHFGHVTQKTFYNGLRKLSGTRCGIQALSDHGIVGRGVLLDYYSWKIKKGEAYDPFSSHSIHLEELLEVAKSQNLTFELGDILLIRSGYTSAYYEYQKTNPKRLEEAAVPLPNLVGVAQTEEIKTWLHDSYFSAVAGDAPAWECSPPKTPWILHEFLLSCWGMPIGEMFDLEALAKQCEKKQRWSFFFVSTPTNVPGGIASLANAMAIQ